VIRLSPQLRTAVQRTTLPILVLLSGAVIVLGKADQLLFDSLRTAVSDTVAPVLDAIARPLNAFGEVVDHARMAVTTYQTNVRLEAENQRLLQWQQAALNLAADNKQLRGLLKAVPETALSFVTARVVANSGGAFVRMILINAGSEDHVSRGQAVLTGEGLVGRLTEVGDRAARVLLITDLNSRIPVTIERSHVAAVLAGDNSERPRLLYLPAGDPIVAAFAALMRQDELTPNWLALRHRLTFGWHKLRGSHRLSDIRVAIFGPAALTALARRAGELDYALPKKSFYAVHAEPKLFFEPRDFSALINDPEIIGLHISPKGRGSERPMPGSLYAWAAGRFGAR